MTSASSEDVRTAVIADRSTAWLESVEPIVAAAGVRVLARATEARIALELVRELRPAVLITGLHLADEQLDGIALARMALGQCESIKVIVVSSSADPVDVETAFAAGACAYAVKSADAADLSAAIRTALSGAIFIAGRHADGNRIASVVTLEPLAKLTRREREILGLVAEGHTNAQLARMLWVTEQTVKFHLSNIYRKLKVSNRTEASRRAQQAGLLASPRSRIAA